MLPDAMGGQRPNFACLMYRCAFTALVQPDYLNPPAFQCSITSQEVAA